MTAALPATASSPRHRLLRSAALAACLVQAMPGAHADRPHGWLPQAHGSAYTLNAGEVSLTGEALIVNDTLDFLDVRDDLVASTRRLEGDSGDLEGYRGAVSAGVTPWLTLFYRHTGHDLTLRLAEEDRVQLENVDQQLSTERREYGLKWNIFEAGRSGQQRPWTAASLEITRQESDSRDFGADIVRVKLDANTSVGFNPPARFSINRMADEGWQGRLLISTPLGSSSTLDLWGGYAERNASSGTGSEIQSDFIRPAFEQEFDTSEKQWSAGIGLQWLIMPRMPLTLGWEYLRITDRELDIRREDSSIPLPSILRPDSIDRAARDNQVLRGSLGWWMTPRFRASVKGYLFTNQFTGIMPHFNNPLSGSFASTTYGYAGLELEYRLGLPGY